MRPSCIRATAPTPRLASNARATRFWCEERSVRRFDLKFDPADRQEIAWAQDHAIDLLAIHDGSVRAAEVFHDQLIRTIGGESAVNPGNQRRIHDEVRPCRTADRLDAPGRKTQRDRRLVPAV